MNTNDWPNVPPPPPAENHSSHTIHAEKLCGAEKSGGVFSTAVNLEGMPDNTGEQQKFSRWKAGISGNPKGRPKGARNKLTETLINTIADDLVANGAEALAKLRNSDVEAYFRVIASIVPRSLIQRHEEASPIDFSMIDDAEAAEILREQHRNRMLEKTYESINR